MDPRRTRRTALRIGLADHHRQVGQGRKLLDDVEAGLDIVELLVQAHPDVTLVDHRIALGVEGEEVDRRVVLDHVLEKAAQKRPRLFAGEGAAGVRAADPRLRQRALHRAGADVVHLAELRNRPQPVMAVRLVPDFPRPGRDGVVAIALGQMRRPGLDQVTPFLQILRRRSPAGDDQRGLVLRLPAVLVRPVIIGQRLGRESDLHQRHVAGFDIGVEDPVHDGPVVDRIAVGILAVGIGRAPFQRRRAVAAAEQVVRADPRRLGTKLGELSQQLLAVLRIGVVRLVIAKPVPQRPIRFGRPGRRGPKWTPHTGLAFSSFLILAADLDEASAGA